MGQVGKPKDSQSRFLSVYFLREITAAFLIVSLMMLAGCQKSVPDLVHNAKTLESRGDFQGAIVSIRAAVQQDPGNGELRFLLGRLNNEATDFAAAEKELRKAMEAGFIGGGRVSLELGRALIAQSKFKELLDLVVAHGAFEPVVRGELNAVRGQAQLALGDLRGATVSRKLAGEEGSQTVGYAILSARLAASESDGTGAVKIVDEALTRFPNDLGLLTMRALLHLAKGDSNGAIGVYSRMLAARSGHYGALMNRSTLLISMGKYKEAEQDVLVLGKLYKNVPDVLAQHGLVELGLGRPQKGLDLALAALKLDAEHSTANLVAGVGNLSLGSLAQADAALKQHLARSPRSISGRRALAATLIRSGRPTQALEVLKPILDSAVAGQRDHALAGDAYAALGQAEQASLWYGRSLEGGNSESEEQFKFALTSLSAGRWEAGTRALESMIAGSDGGGRAGQVLVMMALEKNDYQRAQKVAEELSERSPKSEVAANLMGIVLLAKGEKAEARLAFEGALKHNPGYVPAVKNLARLDIDAGNVKQALGRYERILGVDGKNIEAMLLHAQVNWDAGNLPAAVSMLERAVRVDPTLIEANGRLARLHAVMGHFERAAEIAELLFVRNPDHPDCMLLVAEMRARKGNFGSAVQVLSRLAQMYPKSEQAQVRLGLLQYEGKMTREAEASFKRALEMDPKSTFAQAAYASMLRGEGRMDDAVSFARKLQREQPESVAGFLMEGELLEAQGKHRLALDLYRNAARIRANAQIVLRVYSVRSQLGESEPALRDLIEWVRKQPGDYVVRDALVKLLLHRGDYVGAREHLEVLVAYRPQDWDLKNRLAWTYHRLGDDRALQVAEVAYKLNPNSALTADTLGVIFVAGGKLDRGIGLLRQAVQIEPKNAQIRYHLGAALIRNGAVAEGKKELTVALASKDLFEDRSKALDLLNQIK